MDLKLIEKRGDIAGIGETFSRRKSSICLEVGPCSGKMNEEEDCRTNRINVNDNGGYDRGLVNIKVKRLIQRQLAGIYEFQFKSKFEIIVLGPVKSIKGSNVMLVWSGWGQLKCCKPNKKKVAWAERPFLI